MPLKKAEAKLKLLQKISKAMEDAKRAGIPDRGQILKKCLDLRVKYKTWKYKKIK